MCGGYEYEKKTIGTDYNVKDMVEYSDSVMISWWDHIPIG
jgi:hypothetical protein